MTRGNAKPRYAYCLLIAFLIPFAAFGQAMDEYQVKAAFIYNFARFVEWPAETADIQAPLLTCVLGRDPFGHWLKDTIEGKSIDGRKLTVRDISKSAEAGSCQILFVSSAEPKRTWTALAEMKKPGLLTVGECGEAREDGAIINFFLEGGRVRFEINTEAAELGKIRISSRLLGLARIIRK